MLVQVVFITGALVGGKLLLLLDICKLLRAAEHIHPLAAESGHGQ